MAFDTGDGALGETIRAPARTADWALQSGPRDFRVRSILTFLHEESGAAAAEYAFILALVGSAIASAALTLSNDIDNALTDLGSVLTSVVFSTS